MTMTTVKLGGRLGQEFGQVWHLDIDRPSEAIRAIEANKPGFVKRIQELSDMGLVFRLRLNKRAVDDAEVDVLHGGQSITLMPIVRGAGASGRVILGAVIVAAAYYFSGPVGGNAASLTTSSGALTAYGAVAMMGASMMLGGVVEMLSPQQKIGSAASSNSLSSYAFGATDNVAGQGYAIPVGYGRMLVGSIAVAAGIYAENMGSYTNTNPTLS